MTDEKRGSGQEETDQEQTKQEETPVEKTKAHTALEESFLTLKEEHFNLSGDYKTIVSDYKDAFEEIKQLKENIAKLDESLETKTPAADILKERLVEAGKKIKSLQGQLREAKKKAVPIRSKMMVH